MAKNEDKKDDRKVRILKVSASDKAARKDPWKNPRDPRPKGANG
jgi:hypothetical protein